MIPKSDIENVMSKVRIEDIIDIKTKRKGKNIMGCCPFHTEKTPSFAIFPTTNTYKCFGCGKHGNAITYLMEHDHMSYVQAIKFLAKKYQVEIEDSNDSAMSQEDRQKMERRELIIMAYNKAQDYFVKNLNSSDPESRLAYDYAVKRWGKEYVDRMGIGYASNSYTRFYDFARCEHLPLEILTAVGLLGHSDNAREPYDFFRGRIMIPIRSTSNLLVAYTARVVEDVFVFANQEVPTSKYLNSINSEYYKKENYIFGLDVAQRRGAEEDKFYLVEGGPDVMRLQSLGINNAVACLGSDWTDAQLNELSRYAHKVCIIPDIDVPKAGKKFGIGIEKAMKLGEQCLVAGFSNVTIKDITTLRRRDPEGHDLKPMKITKKMDADSFFTNTKLFDSVHEMDYIVWYASKLKEVSPDDTVSNVTAISRLLSHLPNEFQIDIILDKLSAYIDLKSATWKGAIKQTKCEIEEQRLKENLKSNYLDADLLDEYGFQEKDNRYISVGKQGKRIEWSNFVLHPLFHVKDANFSTRLFEIINTDGHKEIIELTQEDISTRVRFSVKVESLGNFLWLAKDDQLLKLKKFLYKTTDTASPIRKMGWNARARIYAFGNGIFDGRKWHKADSKGIVTLNNDGTKHNFYLPSASSIHEHDGSDYEYEHAFIHQAYGNFTLNEYVSQLILCYGDNAKIAFAYVIATMFRDIFVKKKGHFPILNIFGLKDTGKSDFGHMLTSFFSRNMKAVSVLNSTLAGCSERVAKASNALIHLDEYKNSIDLTKIEFLKGLWESAGRTRMSADGNKLEMTAVEAGVVLTGQEIPNLDIALFTRVIFLKTKPSDRVRTPAQRENYHQLVNMSTQGCTHLTLQILGYRAQLEANIDDSLKIVQADLHSAINIKMEERIIGNWLIPLAAIHALRNCLSLPFTYEDLLHISVPLIIDQEKQSREGSEVAAFWNIIDFLFQKGEIMNGGDFKVEMTSCVKATPLGGEAEEYRFPTPRPLLFLRHRRIMELYQAHLRSTGEQGISKKNMLYYLKMDSEICLGIGVTKRFDVFLDGKQQYAMKELTVKGQTVTKEVPKDTTDQPLVFYYDVLRKNYGLNLQTFDTTSGYDSDESSSCEDSGP